MSREILRQLKEQRANTDFGAVSLVDRESQKQRIMQAIGANQEAEKVSAFDVVWKTVEQVRIAFVSIPAATVTAMLVIAFGGSVGMVGAANSLPGDTLYSVKVASEKARLKIASQERKVLLRTEFAQRRLEEAAKLSSEPERAAEALAQYEVQVKEAKRELEGFKQAEPEAAARVAVEVDGKLDELNSMVNGQIQKEGPTQASGQAIETTKDVSKTVVEVIVDAKDKEVESGSEGEVINDSIRSTFNKRLASALERQTYDFGRITRLKNWYQDRNERVPADINRIETDVEDVSEKLYEAMTLIARGGYRRAFELVEEAESTLLDIEATLAIEEIEVISKQNQEIDEAVKAAEEAEDNSSDGEDEGAIISPDQDAE